MDRSVRIETDKPVVSVVMPFFNSKASMQAAIDSVLGQSFKNLELILVDDCSEDGSRHLARVAAGSDTRVVLISLDINSGAAVARNAGINVCRGDFVAFLDSDDWWPENKLKAQVDFMERTAAEFSYTPVRVVDESGRLLATRTDLPQSVSYRQLLRENVMACSSVMLSRKFVGSHRFPEIRRRQDFAFWLTLLSQGKTAALCVGTHVNYRLSAGSLSSSKIKNVAYNYRMFRDALGMSVIESFIYVLLNIFNKVKRLKAS